MKRKSTRAIMQERYLVPWTNNGGKRIVGKWNIREEKAMKQMERRWIIGWQFYYFSNAAINHRVTMSVAMSVFAPFYRFSTSMSSSQQGERKNVVRACF